MRPVPLILNAVGIVVGVGLGTMMRLGPSDAAPSEAHPAPLASEAAAPARPVHAFRRPFIVPVADGWRTQSLVVMQAEVVLPEGADGLGRTEEAYMRDGIVGALTAMSTQGALTGPLPADRTALEDALTGAVATWAEGAQVRIVQMDKKAV